MNKSKTQTANLRAISAKREINNLNKIYERKRFQIPEHTQKTVNEQPGVKFQSKSALNKRKIWKSPAERPKTNKSSRIKFQSVNNKDNNISNDMKLNFQNETDLKK